MKKIIYLPVILILAFIVQYNVISSDNQKENITNEYVSYEIESIDSNTFYCQRQEKDID